MAIVGDAYVVVRAFTQQFEKDVEDAIKRLKPQFDGLGDGLNDSLRRTGRSSQGLFGNLGREAAASRLAFNRLTRASYLMQPAIFGAISAVSDLIFALGGMIAGIGRAAPALAVLASGFVSVAQAGIAAKLAFGGVGKAIQAILKQQATAGLEKGKPKRVQDDPAVKAAKKAFEKAQKDALKLSEAYAKNLFNAQTKITKAQLALNDAYKAGAEAIQQLRFQAEGAVLSEQKAAIELERARETLMRSMDLPVDSRARREAELAFKEAELNYRMALDKTSDLREEVAYADKTGVDGTKEVISAKQDVIDAQQDLIDLNEKYAEDVEEANDRIEESWERLVDAKKRAREEINKLPPAVEAVNDALKDLSPEARKFAYYIAGLKPVFLDLREAAGKQLFGPLEKAIQNLVDNLVPVLIPILEKTGGVIGDLAVKFSNMLTTPKNLEIFEKIFGEKNLKIIENLGEAFINIADAMLTILDAVSPIAVEFAKFINEKTGDWAKNLSSDTKGLSDMFERAAEAAKRIGNALGGLWDGFSAFGKMASDMGLDLIDSLGDSGRAMADFFSPKTKKGQDEMKAKFAQIGENVKSIGNFFGEVMKFLFEMAGNPGVKAFFDAIAVIPMMFADSGKEMTMLGKTMGEFFVSIAKVIELLIESGGANAFFTTLTSVATVLGDILSIPIVQEIFKILAVMKGFALALGTIGKIGKFIFGATILAPLQSIFGFFKKTDGVSKFTTLMDKLKGVFTKLGEAAKWVMGRMTALFGWLKTGFSTIAGYVGKILGWVRGAFSTIVQLILRAFQAIAFAASMNPVGAIIIGIMALIAIFVIAYNKSETFRKIVNAAFEKIKSVVMGVIDWFMENVPKAFQFIKDAFLKYTLLGVVISNWDKIVEVIKKAINWIKEKVSAAWEFVKDVFFKFTPLGIIIKNFDKIIEFLKSLPQKFKDAAGNIWGWLTDGLKNAWNSVKEWWNNNVAGKGIRIDVPDILPGPDEYNINIPKFAQGGVVYPRSGGVLGVLAEAGRAERIEPLDSYGMSKRDYRIIDFLEDWRNINGGGRGETTINVHPSPNMDERVLAMLINRRLESSRLRGV